MKLTIELRLDGAVFWDDFGDEILNREEVGRVLRGFADRVEADGLPDLMPLLDGNGNVCGSVEVQR